MIFNAEVEAFTGVSMVITGKESAKPEAILIISVKTTSVSGPALCSDEYIDRAGITKDALSYS